MNKFILFITSLLFCAGLNAANTPCSGAMGGIDHCQGEKFVCRNGKISQSKKSCSSYFQPTSTSLAKRSSQNTIQPKSKKGNVAAAHQYPAISRSGQILQLDYPGYRLWLDCTRHASYKFQYTAARDTGDNKRANRFYLDPSVPSDCQQTSSNAYVKGYDRGHLVPANHLDFSAESIRMSNYMTNILPQASSMNRGAWYQTELTVECYRDIDELLVIGGVIWPAENENHRVLMEHSVEVPKAFWKVIIRGIGQDERAIAWIIPNDSRATIKRLDEYLVSVNDIERATGESIPVAQYAKHDTPSTSWLIPYGCNKG